jgi:hypothetical protein
VFCGFFKEGDSAREWVYFAPLQGMTEVTEMDMGCVLGEGSATPHGITDVCFVRVYAGSEAERYAAIMLHSMSGILEQQACSMVGSTAIFIMSIMPFMLKYVC